MDNTPNDIFGKDLFIKEEQNELIPIPDGNKGVMHNHTIYSIYDGVQTPLEVVRAAKKAGYKNICLSDHGTLMGLSPFLKACKDEGVNGVPGVEMYVSDPEYPEVKRGHMCLYAKDSEGLKIISKIQEASYKQYEESGISTTKRVFPITSLEILRKFVKKRNIIATTACVNGIVAQVLCGNQSVQRKYQKLQGQIIEYDIDSINEQIDEINNIENKRDELKNEVKKLANVSTTPLTNSLKMAENKEEIKEKIKEIRADNKIRAEKRKRINAEIKELNAVLKIKKPERTILLKEQAKYESLREKMKALPIVPVEKRRDRAIKLLEKLKKIFGSNFYIELQYHGLDSEKEYYPQILEIAKELNIKTVIANDAHYDVKGRDKQRWLVSSAGLIAYYDMINMPDETDDQYFIKTEDELKEKLLEILPLEDIEKAIDNTYSALANCKVEIDNSLHFPKFPVPEDMSSAEYLKKLAYEGMMERWGELKEDVKKRVDYELNTIINMGYADYLLIVRDYVMYGREINENYVGSGRGSAYGSVVCWLIGITEGVNPMDYGLLFERFLNPERVSMPDIDTDFAEAIRNKMFDYVASKYGEDHTSHISTINIIQAKGAYRTACRVLEKAINENFFKLFNLKESDIKALNKISASRPLLLLGDLLSKAYDISLKELDEKEIEVNELTEDSLTKVYGTFPKSIIETVIASASILYGMPSSLGLHAAGCIISDNPITDYSPVRVVNGPEDKDITAIEADMTQAEEDFGLLKMDFLGLTTLDIISVTLDNIEKTTGERLRIQDISIDDENVYSEIFSKGRTNGIFQFESNGMKDTLKKFKPDKFEDIVLINAVFRPGPLQYINNIINIKSGISKPEYITESLKPILEMTYGFPVYQEQLMQIFNKVAGFSLGESDIIRRALSKKKVEQFKKYMPQFIEGMKKTGVQEQQAKDYWNQLLEFSNYAFNKSHAVAYSLLAYRCAWLKYYYPKEFACAVLTYESETEKKASIISDLKKMGIKIAAPDFRTVEILPTVTSKDSISIGLTNIKGLGKKNAENIINYRNELSKYDLVDILGLPPASVSLLASIGMFDYLNIRRFEIKNIVDDNKFNGEKMREEIEEKDNLIEELYEKFSEESGIDINKLKMNSHPFTESELSDTQYLNRIKKIDKVKEERNKLIKKYKTAVSYINEIQNSLQENIFKVTLEDKREELVTTGFYLGKTPLDMAGLVVEKDNPEDLQEGEEAYFPLIVDSGYIAPSRIGNDYLTLRINNKSYRSFDEDVIDKAKSMDLVNQDIFKFCLIKMKKKNDYVNVTEIVREIEVNKKEVRLAVRNRNVLKEIMKNKVEPLRVYIEDENKFVYVMGEAKDIDYVEIC